MESQSRHTTGRADAVFNPFAYGSIGVEEREWQQATEPPAKEPRALPRPAERAVGKLPMVAAHLE